MSKVRGLQWRWAMLTEFPSRRPSVNITRLECTHSLFFGYISKMTYPSMLFYQESRIIHIDGLRVQILSGVHSPFSSSAVWCLAHFSQRSLVKLRVCFWVHSHTNQWRCNILTTVAPQWNHSSEPNLAFACLFDVAHKNWSDIFLPRPFKVGSRLEHVEWVIPNIKLHLMPWDMLVDMGVQCIWRTHPVWSTVELRRFKSILPHDVWKYGCIWLGITEYKCTMYNCANKI